ncbi:MAG TPA: alginate export family protein [Gammaproteobacteria bacterium]|nr:alginate export family protein [Gammaproteobacteria bacterium]
MTAARLLLDTRSWLAAACATILCAATAAPAGAEEASHFDFGGVQRTRYESIDAQFRPNLSTSDRLLALQTSLLFDLKLPKVEFHGELLDSRGQWNDTGSFVSTTIVDALEPQQLYVAWNLDGALQDGSKSTLRAGRMTLDLGKRRVLARSRYSNAPAGFVGADWDWRAKDGRELRAFYLAPMRNLPADSEGLLDDDYELDRSTRDTSLTGIYYQLPPFPDKSTFEVYLLDLDSEPSRQNLAVATADLLTVGARIYRNPEPKHWTYEVEPILQRGESADAFGGVTRTGLDHDAYYVHAEVGYAFASKWAPVLLVQYSFATGDKDPTDARIERFNSLFGDRTFEFGPTDIYGAISRTNVDMLGVRLTLKPKPRWQTMVNYADVRLAEARDAWAGAGWRDPTGASGTEIGRQLEARVTWAAYKNRLSLETGVTHFDFGRFPQQTAGASFRGDPTFFYTALTTTF